MPLFSNCFCVYFQGAPGVVGQGGERGPQGANVGDQLNVDFSSCIDVVITLFSCIPRTRMCALVGCCQLA